MAKYCATVGLLVPGLRGVLRAALAFACSQRHNCRNARSRICGGSFFGCPRGVKPENMVDSDDARRQLLGADDEDAAAKPSTQDETTRTTAGKLCVEKEHDERAQTEKDATHTRV